MNKMTEDNCRIGDPKVMTNTKGVPKSQNKCLGIAGFNILLRASGLQQTTRAPGSDNTRGQGSFGPFTGGTTQKFKKEEGAVHWTRFTKTG